jgi:conjugative transfer signal peptidase TraF
MPKLEVTLKIDTNALAKVALVFSGFALVLASLTAASIIGGYSFNQTSSLPDSIYRVTSVQDAKVGDIVNFCAPKIIENLPAGFCPGGKSSLLKRVVAAAGDRVEVTANGVFIDGSLEPVKNSAPRENSSNGLALNAKFGKFELKAGELFVMGEHPDSYDSRYFGVVSGKDAL